MQPKKDETPKVQEERKLGPVVRGNEEVFGVAHIFASFNDTFVVRITSIPSHSGGVRSLILILNYFFVL